MYWLLFAASLIMPGIMLILGIRWLKHPPANHNAFFAYRSELAEKNEATWAFIHHYIAKLWLRCAIVLLPVTIFVMLYFREKYMSFLPWIIAVQGGLFAVTLFPSEGALRVNFDEDGQPLNGPKAAPPVPQVEEERVLEDSAGDSLPEAIPQDSPETDASQN